MRRRWLSSVILRASLAVWLSFLLMTCAASRVRSDDVDLNAIEHASHIFVGTVDIITATQPNATDYTVLVRESFKGDLPPQSLIVAREAGFQSLVPGEDYLFLARYEPAALRYLINSVLPVPSDAGVAAWRDAIGSVKCAVDDVLRLDGVTYARRDWNDDKRYLDREWVGPSIARVAVQERRRPPAGTISRTDQRRRFQPARESRY